VAKVRSFLPLAALQTRESGIPMQEERGAHSTAIDSNRVGFCIILGMPTEVRACTVLFLFINIFKVKEETFIRLN
jgi:hypothetical protein